MPKFRVEGLETSEPLKFKFFRGFLSQRKVSVILTSFSKRIICHSLLTFLVRGAFEIVYLLLEKDIFDYVIMEGQKQFRRMLWQQLVLIWGRLIV